MDFNIPSPLRVAITREQLLTKIATNMVLPVWYKITDALGGAIPVYVVGESLNTIRRTAIKEDSGGSSYLYGTYTIGTTGNNDDVFTAQGGGTGDEIQYAVATGTDTYAATLPSPIPAHIAGEGFFIKFTNSNTGASTINLSALGPVPLRKNGAIALASGDILAAQTILIVYDAAGYYECIGIAASAGGAFIPLAGTTPGNEVTGNIELQNTGPVTTFIEPIGAGGAQLHTNDGAGVDTYIQTTPDAAIMAVSDGSVSSTIEANDAFSTKNETSGPAGIGNVTTEENHSKISATDLASTSEIDITEAHILLQSDTLNFPGAEYGADYSADYTNRSLVDKAYVDNVVAGAPSIVYLTRAALQALIAGSTLNTTVTYAITNAIGSTAVMFVWAATVNNLQSAMIDQTNTRFGFYNITADTFTQVYINAVSAPGTGDMLYFNAGTGLWTKLAAGVSGQILTANGAAAPTWGEGWKEALMSGDVTTTSATAVDITGLSFALAANSKYIVNVTKRIGCSGLNGVKMGWNMPASTTYGITILGSGATSAAQNLFSASISAQTLGASIYNNVVGVNGSITQSILATTGGTAGTFQLQFASGLAGQTSTVFADSSFLTYKKVA